MLNAIDPHVHCRDGRQSYKETIGHALAVAKQQGIQKIFDMPNTDPPILGRRDVEKRLRLVPRQYEGNYYLYLGLTANFEQIKEAVYCYRHYRQVVGFKLYAGKSVGSLAVSDPNKQKKIYKILAKLNYQGVLAVHCEKESYLKPNLWQPANPISHSFARPKKAETASVRDQVHFAYEAGFSGILHIVHVSVPESVALVAVARKKMRITCGITPHHLLWDSRRLNRLDGLIYKMNPPLRPQKDVQRMRQLLKTGQIDWIETDHAPHAIGEKLFPPYMSGYPSLYLYGDFIKKTLPNWGFSKAEIRALTFTNIIRAFGRKLEDR